VCEIYTELTLDLPFSRRGEEIPYNQIDLLNPKISSYRIKKIAEEI